MVENDSLSDDGHLFFKGMGKSWNDTLTGPRHRIEILIIGENVLLSPSEADPGSRIFRVPAHLQVVELTFGRIFIWSIFEIYMYIYIDSRSI
jgi:hypothetical protein